MNHLRKVSFLTKLRLANKRPILFRSVLTLTLIPLIYSLITYELNHRHSTNPITELDFYIYYGPVIPLLIIGTLLTIYFLVSLNYQIRLLKSGEIRDAELISYGIKPSISFPASSEKYWVKYKYLIAGNNKVDGQSETREQSIIKDKQPGDRIKIIVSRENEFKTCLMSSKDAQENGWQVD